MSTIRKSSNPAEIHVYDKEFWWARTPQERLAAALKLIRRAKAIYYANPTNPLLSDGEQVLKSDKPITENCRFIYLTCLSWTTAGSGR